MYMACVQGAPIALRMAKAAINKGMDVDLQTAYALEHSYYAQVPIPAIADFISCAFISRSALDECISLQSMRMSRFQVNESSSCVYLDTVTVYLDTVTANS